MPDWQLTPEEELLGESTFENGALQPMVDENGMPLQCRATLDRRRSRWFARRGGPISTMA